MFSYHTYHHSIWAPSSSVLSNVTNICHIFCSLIISPGGQLCALECFVFNLFIFLSGPWLEGYLVHRGLHRWSKDYCDSQHPPRKMWTGMKHLTWTEVLKWMSQTFKLCLLSIFHLHMNTQYTIEAFVFHIWELI